jgi:hypothetical protein
MQVATTIGLWILFYPIGVIKRTILVRRHLDVPDQTGVRLPPGPPPDPDACYFVLLLRCRLRCSTPTDMVDLLRSSLRLALE